MTSIIEVPPDIRPREPLGPVAARTAKPVKWFAAAGAFFVLLSVYVYTRWLAGGPHATPVGASAVPGYMKVAAIVLQIAAPAVALYLLWRCLIRPWRRDGRPSLDGMLVVAFLTLLWQDSYADYTQYIYTYNSYYVNLGSWNNFIPGWNAPNGGRFVEPVLITGVFYVVFAFAGVALANFTMRKAKARAPKLGTFGLIGVAFATLVLLDLVAEPIFCFFGVWVYGSVPAHFGLFHGHYYQFPLFEPLIWGAAWTSMAALRYFKNDRGESVAERGVEQVHASSATKTGLRFLAVIGALNLGYLLFCNIPYQWIDTHAKPWPRDIITRSYFNQGICGAGTGYECPGGSTPVFNRGGQHISPTGAVIQPDGTVLSGPKQ